MVSQLKARDQPVPSEAQNSYFIEPEDGKLTNCTIFLGYTSNLISSGLRETIRYLVQNRLVSYYKALGPSISLPAQVDVLVTSAGGVEEDFIKCLAPTYLGDFALAGRDLRQKGVNRIGNLLIPNSNYCMFEQWIMPILDQLLEEQKTKVLVMSCDLHVMFDLYVEGCNHVLST